MGIHRVPVRGTNYHVNGATGVDTNTGLSWRSPYLTIAKAITVAGVNDKIRVAPKGSGNGYDETLTIPYASKGLVIEGVGPRGSVFVVPTAVGGKPLINHADDVTLLNLGLETNGAGFALENYGSRLRVLESKLEGGALAAHLTLGTAAQIAAATHGAGADILLEDCELAWVTDCLRLGPSDYGPVTQVRLRRCLLHGFTTDGVNVVLPAGGEAQHAFRDLWLEDCEFGNAEDGTEPTRYLDLDGHADNTGRVSGCRFPVVVASALVATGTKLVRSGNFYTNGHD